MTLRIISMFVLLSLLPQCRKKQPDGPPPVSIPYFKCVVNGQKWGAGVPTNPIGPAAVDAQYIESTGDLTLMAVKKTDGGGIYEKIIFATYGIQQTGDYVMYTGDGNTIGFMDFAGNNACTVYYHDPGNPGLLTVTTFDSIQRTVKGTFHVVLKNSGCGPDSLMTLLDGKFAFRY